MRYAGGRPLWQLSLSVHSRGDGKPVPVLRVGPTTWRKLEALRDQIMRGVGTQEPWYLENPVEFEGETGIAMIAANWRKPLRIDEVAQMAPTPEVRAREGRA